MGRVKPEGGMPWLQLLKPGEEPDASAAAAIYEIGDSFTDFEPKRASGSQLVGLSVQGPALEAAIPFALENKLELMVLDGTRGSELAGPPDMTVLRDAIRILRGLNREEEIDLIWYGGVRSGTDVAKALALGGVAAAVGVSMAIAAGGTVAGGRSPMPATAPWRNALTGAEYLIQSMAAETSIMARCTGKTNVQNLEPEDLKTITVAAMEATGFPWPARDNEIPRARVQARSAGAPPELAPADFFGGRPSRSPLFRHPELVLVIIITNRGDIPQFTRSLTNRCKNSAFTHSPVSHKYSYGFV